MITAYYHFSKDIRGARSAVKLHDKVKRTLPKQTEFQLKDSGDSWCLIVTLPEYTVENYQRLSRIYERNRVINSSVISTGGA